MCFCSVFGETLEEAPTPPRTGMGKRRSTKNKRELQHLTKSQVLVQGKCVQLQPPRIAGAWIEGLKSVFVVERRGEVNLWRWVSVGPSSTSLNCDLKHPTQAATVGLLV